MSTAERANARNAPAAPAPSSSRGSNIPSRGPAPVGAYQAYLDCKRRDQEQTKLMEIDRMYERRPIHLEWEEHRANVDVIRQAFEAERASAAPQPPPPPAKAGRIASMLPQRLPAAGDANATLLESIPGSARVAASRARQQDVLADNRRRWLGQLRPPVIHEENSSSTALYLLPKPLLEVYLYLTQDGPAERTSFLPECIRETVTAEIGQGPLPSSFFFTDPSISGQTIKRMDQVRDRKEELDKLKKLMAEAAQCGTQDRDWTTRVRAPLIAHVIGSRHTAEIECCILGLRARTAMHPDCIPVPAQLLHEDLGIIEGRVSMTINIKDSSRLSRAIEQKQPAPRAPVQFVNHIHGDIYGSIPGETSEGVLGEAGGNGHAAAASSNYPIACMIESQARPVDDGAMHRWGVDLGIHAAALHNRLSRFLDAKYGADRKENYRLSSVLDPDDGIPEPMYRPLIPALPLIFVAGHDWYLYFACDRDTEIVLLSGVPMGSTRDLVAVYQLVKVLRDVCRYLENHYKPWLVTLFDCQWPHNPWGGEATNRPLHAGR